MDCKWKVFVMLLMVRYSWQMTNDAVTDDPDTRLEILTIAQCEATHQHMCPGGLCTVQSSVQHPTSIHDYLTPAKHFCDDVCRRDAGCRTVCRCAEKLLPDYELATTAFQASLRPKPQLHCREPTVLSIKWEYKHDPANKTPIVFAVEILEFGELWTPYTVTRSNITVIRGLLPRQKYKFRVTAVGPKGVAGIPAVSDWISTLPPPGSDDFILSPPAEVNQIGPIKYSTSGAAAVIGWKPAEGATCSYSIGWHLKKFPKSAQYSARPHSKSVYVLDSPMQVEINQLILGESYSVYVKSHIADSHEESEARTELPHSLDVKECLSAFNYNLSVCEAPAPTDLNLSFQKEGNKSLQVTVSWKTVPGNPTGYKVFLYDVRTFIDNRTIQGTESSAIFDNVPIRHVYFAKVMAFSPAGDGSQARKMQPFEESDIANRISPVNVSSRKEMYEYDTVKAAQNISVAAKSLSPEARSMVTYYALGALALLMLFSIPGSFALRKYMEHKRKTERPLLMAPLFRRPGGDCWELRREKLQLRQKLGEGAFGTVFLGELCQESGGTRQVAVKMLRDQPTAEELGHFQNEMAILKSVKSDPYIVQLIGCITLAPQKKIVMEFCALGNLQTLLRKMWSDLTGIEVPSDENCGSADMEYYSIEPAPRLWSSNCPAYANATYGILLGEGVNPSAELLSLARQIARGMQFLAAAGILHRDLATRNVLIAEDGGIRISDFGLSREVLESSVYRKLGCERIAVKWIAPECLENRVYTTQSDVWSYGIVLWEIVTLGSSPYAELGNDLDLQRSLRDFFKRGDRLKPPPNCSSQLYEIMLECWHGNPESRPTFQALRERMENLENHSQSERHISLAKDVLLTFSTQRLY